MPPHTELMKLYSDRILALAASMPRVGRLEHPHATAVERSPLCGSKITVDVVIKDGKIADFAHDVKACALGQASASITGMVVIGCGRNDIQCARDQLYAMITTGGATPLAPFDGLEALRPAGAYKNRHASILLSLDATLAAWDAAIHDSLV